MTRFSNYRIVKRPQKRAWAELLAVIIAIVAATIVSAGLIIASDANVLDALEALFKGAFGSRNAALETLVQSTPLMFTGLAVLVAFRGRVWNIGAEGQFWAGAMATAWISMNLTNLPRPALLAIVVLGSMVAGAFWGFIPGYFKTRFGANIIVVTIMMNYIIQFLLSYLLAGPWGDPEQHWLQTIRFDEITFLPTFFDSRLHLGFFLALLMAVIVYILLWKTPLGYEIRAIGDNPSSSEYKGINVKRTIILIMVISGAIAGLGGGTELGGIHHRLRMDISSGYGFTGILIAVLGRLNPFGVVLAAIFFGALVNGSTMMQVFAGVPFALVYSVQGITLIFLLIATVVTEYRLERVQHVE